MACRELAMAREMTVGEPDGSVRIKSNSAAHLASCAREWVTSSFAGVGGRLGFEDGVLANVSACVVCVVYDGSQSRTRGG